MLQSFYGTALSDYRKICTFLKIFKKALRGCEQEIKLIHFKSKLKDWMPIQFSTNLSWLIVSHYHLSKHKLYFLLRECLALQKVKTNCSRWWESLMVCTSCISFLWRYLASCVTALEQNTHAEVGILVSAFYFSFLWKNEVWIISGISFYMIKSGWDVERPRNISILYSFVISCVT